jgi:predicted negative regulator of RcsB-dependent stress response
MKKLIVLVVLALVVWLGVNYARTGKLSLMPAASSPEEQHLQELEAELKSIDSQIDQAGRAAGATGMDTTGDVSALMARKDKLVKQIEEARAKVH